MVTRTQILACQFEGDMHVWTTVRKLICWLFWKVVTKNLIVLFFTALTKCQILLCLFKENVWTAVRRIYMLTWMRDCFFGSNLDILLTKIRVFILRECMNNSEENPICWLMDVRKVVTLVYLCFFLHSGWLPGNILQIFEQQNATANNIYLYSKRQVHLHVDERKTF